MKHERRWTGEITFGNRTVEVGVHEPSDSFDFAPGFVALLLDPSEPWESCDWLSASEARAIAAALVAAADELEGK